MHRCRESLRDIGPGCPVVCNSDHCSIQQDFDFGNDVVVGLVITVPSTGMPPCASAAADSPTAKAVTQAQSMWPTACMNGLKRTDRTALGLLSIRPPAHARRSRYEAAQPPGDIAVSQRFPKWRPWPSRQAEPKRRVSHSRDRSRGPYTFGASRRCQLLGRSGNRVSGFSTSLRDRSWPVSGCRKATRCCPSCPEKSTLVDFAYRVGPALR